MSTTSRDRARGALVGLAFGDALGAPVEFLAPEAIAGRRDELFGFPGGGAFGWSPGEFTDDTQMSLILARHLESNGAVDQDRLAKEFGAWATHPQSADVGNQTRAALAPVAAGEDWRDAISRLDPDAEGNGSLMRTAPAALAPDEMTVRRWARHHSELTHPNPLSIDACEAYSVALHRTVATGALPSLEEFARLALEPLVQHAIRRAASGPPPEMSGYVVDTFAAAVWAVYGADTFEDAAWRAVALGRDADTVGAVAGALAGARWGRSAIPDAQAARLGSKHPMFAGATYPAEFERLADAIAKT